MTLKKAATIFLVVVLVLTLGGAYALLSDTETIRFSGQGATLILEIGGSTSTKSSDQVSFDFGNNIVPGDEGTKTIHIVNGGSVSGVVCYEVIKMPPEYLSVQVDSALCGTVLAPQEAKDFNLYWHIPADTNLGSGGQSFDFQLSIVFTQQQ